MYTGTLISDLLSTVEQAESFAKERSQIQETGEVSSIANSANKPGSLQSEQFPQPFRLRPADRNLGLLLVVHPELVGTLEPRNHLANPVDIHHVGAVGPPKKVRV